MHIFGKRLDGVDLVLAIVGAILVLLGVAMTIAFFNLEGAAGRVVMAATAVAMYVAGFSLLNTKVFRAMGIGKKPPPAIDG
jgi:hypothetical protein